MKRNPVTGKVIPEPATYLLRDIDAGLWEQFKARAEQTGVPMRTVMLELIGAFASGALEVEQQIVVRPTRKGGLTFDRGPLAVKAGAR